MTSNGNVELNAASKEDGAEDAASSGLRPIHGSLLVLAASFLWSFGGVFVKTLTVRCGAAPEAVACLRSAVAGLVLAWALPGVVGAPVWGIVGAGVAYTVVVGGFVAATAGTTAANAIFLQYFYPLLVAVGARLWFSQALDRRTLVAVGLGTAGVLTILVGSWQPGHHAGVSCGVVSAFAFAAFTLLQRGLHKGNAIGLVSMFNLIAAAVLLPFAFGKLRLSAAAYALVGLQGVVQLGLPYVLFVKGLRVIPAADAAIITLLEPVLNPLWVWIAIGEVPNRWTVIGSTAIICALLSRFLRIPTRH